MLACPNFSDNFMVCAIYLPTYSFANFSLFKAGCKEYYRNNIHSEEIIILECRRKMPHISGSKNMAYF